MWTHTSILAILLAGGTKVRLLEIFWSNIKLLIELALNMGSLHEQRQYLR